MTDDLLDRLAREAIDETRNAAAAEGWFSAAIDVTIDRAHDAATVTLSRDDRRADAHHRGERST